MNFQDALNTNVSDIERPPLMPVGTYKWAVGKVPTLDTIAEGRFDVVDFHLRCVEPTDDVDTDDLATYGKITGAPQRLRFMFNKEDEAEFKRSLFRLKTFLTDHLGIESEGRPLKEALNEAVNAQFLGSIKWRTDKRDGETQYAEIDKTAPLG